jgi:hypothetical protein
MIRFAFDPFMIEKWVSPAPSGAWKFQITLTFALTPLIS